MALPPRTTQHFDGFKSNFARTLKSLCGSKGSINKVCLELGVNRQQFAKYLTGSTLPSLYALQRMADYFEVDPSVFFVARPGSSKLALAKKAAPPPPDVAQGYYLEYAAVIAENKEALRVSAWKFSHSGAQVICHGEVPDFQTSQRFQFAQYHGTISSFGSAMTLNATTKKNRNANMLAVLMPFETGPNDYIALSLRVDGASRSEVIGSASIFRFAGNAPDLVALVSEKCGTFHKAKFNKGMSQTWALIARQCALYELTIRLTL